MSPENEPKILADLEQRKSRINGEIAAKTESMNLFKLREEHSTEDERQEALQLNKEIKDLEAELKEIEADIEKYKV